MNVWFTNYHAIFDGTSINYTHLTATWFFQHVLLKFSSIGTTCGRQSPVRAGPPVIQPNAPRVSEHHFVHFNFGCPIEFADGLEFGPWL